MQSNLARPVRQERTGRATTAHHPRAGRRSARCAEDGLMQRAASFLPPRHLVNPHAKPTDELAHRPGQPDRTDGKGGIRPVHRHQKSPGQQSDRHTDHHWAGSCETTEPSAADCSSSIFSNRSVGARTIPRASILETLHCDTPSQSAKSVCVQPSRSRSALMSIAVSIR